MLLNAGAITPIEFINIVAKQQCRGSPITQGAMLGGVANWVLCNIKDIFILYVTKPHLIYL